jgi:Ca2+:H+ antiporter
MTDTLSSLMIITSVALLLPAALYSTLTTMAVYSSTDTGDNVLAFSRGTSVVLLLLYILFLYFQMVSHLELFQPESSANSGDSNSEESLWASALVLFIAAAGIVLCTDFLLEAIPIASKHTFFTQRFLAAIAVPIASNAPEFVTIFTLTKRGRTDFVMGVIAGSILQIALLVIPLLVIFGWITGQEMTLRFEMFQTTLLFFAVLVVNRLLKDENQTYLQGLMLVVT